MNCLDFEDREFKNKVTARSYVKQFRTPYLLNGLKCHIHI